MGLLVDVVRCWDNSDARRPPTLETPQLSLYLIITERPSDSRSFEFDAVLDWLVDMMLRGGVLRLSGLMTGVE